MIPCLSNLGKKAGTDKGDHRHSYGGRSYLDWYYAHFREWCHRTFNFLEIGVLEGKSLNMWHEFFPNATIWGIDCTPGAANVSCVEWGAKIRIGSQDNPDFLREVASEAKSFGIVVDDGSHIAEHMRISYETLWPFIAPGGWYAFEDLMMTYNAEWTETQVAFGRDPSGLAGQQKQSREPIESIVKTAMESADGQSGSVFEIHHYSMLLLIRKLPA
jgi:hypothetical protein